MTQPQRYSQEVEVMQLTEDNIGVVVKWLNADWEQPVRRGYIFFTTKSHQIIAKFTDYIIKHPGNSFTVESQEEFERKGWSNNPYAKIATLTSQLALQASWLEDNEYHINLMKQRIAHFEVPESTFTGALSLNDSTRYCNCASPFKSLMELNEHIKSFASVKNGEK